MIKFIVTIKDKLDGEFSGEFDAVNEADAGYAAKQFYAKDLGTNPDKIQIVSTEYVLLSDIKTIDINTKEWFDRVNGNSYFSARVTVNFGMPDVFEVLLPFQYGYGNHSQHMAFKALRDKGIIKDMSDTDAPWSYCGKHNIIQRYSKQENCKKRDVVAFTS